MNGRILIAIIGLLATLIHNVHCGSMEAMLDDDDDPAAGLDSDSAESAMLMAESGETMMVSTSNGMTVTAPSGDADDKDTAMMPVHMEHEDDRKKKSNKGLQDIYMAFMMVKSIISSMMMFLSPVMQMKGFGLSVINTLINVAKFVVQLRNMQQGQRPASLWLDDRVVRRSELPPIKRFVQAPPSDFSAWAGPSAMAHTSAFLPPTTYAPHRRNKHPYRFYKPSEPWSPGATPLTVASSSASTSTSSSSDRWGPIQPVQANSPMFDEPSNFLRRSSEQEIRGP